MVANVALPGLAQAATPDTELGQAYEWARSKGITTMDSYEAANMGGAITRAQMAKMLSVYATEILKATPDESASCTFVDIDSVKGDLHDFIIESCQLGIMGQNVPGNKFRPYDNISRAEFGTALSRVLYGEENNGGTPYYANHLSALKDAGIMTQIDNPEGRDEIRGYVMLMLMRAEAAGIDCNDEMTQLACAMESDECPAACREKASETNEEPSDTVVRAGDLAVKVTPATERKAIVNTTKEAVSDLDTITLKASEKITVNSITLERFGYSTAADVYGIWLEDAYGNKIADEKSLSSSKDTVTLKIKKEYRDMDENNAITIVLKTTTWAKVGGTIGFKVTDVDSSAKNLDLSDYNPYTYDLVEYDGATVTLSVKGNSKEYNYEEGKLYEVSRLKVKAGASILALNGITLTNEGTWSYVALDLDEYVSNVKVTADGKEVSGLKWNVTKENEIVLSWDTIEVAINKDVQLIVSVALENLDEFGKVARLVLSDGGDLNATEKKTGARISVAAPETTSDAWKVYSFNGSKIKLTNTKLSSTIDAAQGSQDVVIAKGTITVAEEVKLTKLVFNADTGVIEDMTLDIAWEKYDAGVSADKKTFTFQNVFIEESGDFELSVDVIDEEVSGQEVTVKLGTSTSIGKAAFDANNARYESSRKYVNSGDVAGSIVISKLKVQESKGSLTNSRTTKRSVVINENKDEKVFDGTYTAKKGTVYLDNVKITLVTWAAQGADMNFTVEIDGQKVEIDNPTAEWTDVDFEEPIEVAAWKSVAVKVTAYAYAESGSAPDFEYKITVSGKDDKGNDAGSATKSMAKIAFVGADKITVSSSTTAKKQDVILAADNQVVSRFVVAPDKKSSEATVDDAEFYIGDFYDLLVDLNDGETTPANWSDPDNFFEFAIWSADADNMSFTGTNSGNLVLVVTDMGAKISKESDAKLTFKETLKSTGANGDEYDTKLLSINGEPQTGKEFYRLVVNSLVKVVSQTKEDWETEYTFEIDYSDDATNNSIDYVEFTYDTNDAAGDDYAVFYDVTEWKNGYTAKNIKDSSRYVTYIKWEDGDGQVVQLDYNVYTDFFKVGGKRIQTFSN